MIIARAIAKREFLQNASEEVLFLLSPVKIKLSQTSVQTQNILFALEYYIQTHKD